MNSVKVVIGIILIIISIGMMEFLPTTANVNLQIQQPNTSILAKLPAFSLCPYTNFTSTYGVEKFYTPTFYRGLIFNYSLNNLSVVTSNGKTIINNRFNPPLQFGWDGNYTYVLSIGQILLLDSSNLSYRIVNISAYDRLALGKGFVFLTINSSSFALINGIYMTVVPYEFQNYSSDGNNYFVYQPYPGYFFIPNGTNVFIYAGLRPSYNIRNVLFYYNGGIHFIASFKNFIITTNSTFILFSNGSLGEVNHPVYCPIKYNGGLAGIGFSIKGNSVILSYFTCFLGQVNERGKIPVQIGHYNFTENLGVFKDYLCAYEYVISPNNSTHGEIAIAFPNLSINILNITKYASVHLALSNNKGSAYFAFPWSKSYERLYYISPPNVTYLGTFLNVTEIGDFFFGLNKTSVGNISIEYKGSSIVNVFPYSLFLRSENITFFVSIGDGKTIISEYYSNGTINQVQLNFSAVNVGVSYDESLLVVTMPDYIPWNITYHLNISRRFGETIPIGREGVVVCGDNVSQPIFFEPGYVCDLNQNVTTGIVKVTILYQFGFYKRLAYRTINTYYTETGSYLVGVKSNVSKVNATITGNYFGIVLNSTLNSTILLPKGNYSVAFYPIISKPVTLIPSINASYINSSEVLYVKYTPFTITTTHSTHSIITQSSITTATSLAYTTVGGVLITTNTSPMTLDLSKYLPVIMVVILIIVAFVVFLVRGKR
ncbi:hypothetical protein HS7_12750 [Sulfolobales archaeon HS-7]|nr:hypothetical protein HS7_12750 [Sulfolobales archaeon HS-7]